MSIYNAVLTGRRVLFVGYNHAAGDVCKIVLAACALVSPPVQVSDSLVRRQVRVSDSIVSPAVRVRDSARLDATHATPPSENMVAGPMMVRSCSLDKERSSASTHAAESQLCCG